MSYPIPKDALDDRLAFVGTAGSGKTYNAGTGVEMLLHRAARVVIADPLGVWWGLRLRADGKTPSPFNVVIFGGPHGDIAINEHAGALIGETVAGMAESCIVDLSQIGTKAGERRFMLAFLTALYRKTAGEPLHLVVDEADMFAPQRLMDKDGDAARLLGIMETIVRRGRVKGFIPWLITQRPAVLSKDVLSQADGMVAFKLTASQDRAAIGAWIEGQADQQQGKTILASLPAMQRGQGVVWVPGRSILETAAFPEKATFDSSRTPKRGESKRTATLKPLDLGALKDRLSTIEAETKANDPKALKAEVARLTQALAARAPAVDRAAVENAYKQGLAEGVNQGEKRAKAALTAIKNWLGDAIAVAASSLDGLDTVAPTPGPHVAAPPARPALKPSQPAATGSLPGPQQRILNSLATWLEMGEGAPSNAQVAWLANYSPSSTSYTNPRSALKTGGLIEYPSGDRLSLTAKGTAYGAAISLPGSLLDFVLSNLPGPEARILRSVAQHHPDAIDNEAAASGANYSASSTSYTNPRSALKTKDLISYPSNGLVRAADWLFAIGARP
ncbi:hypothetical protein [Tardiphaga sp.]|jgi:hypothetical protein|uniref:hypothetical protein n=1 Tax=Tardiphaga sp. TaxID=1926292 RepID=UPI0037DA3FD3